MKTFRLEGRLPRAWQALGALLIAVPWIIKPAASFSYSTSQWLYTIASIICTCVCVVFLRLKSKEPIGLAPIIALGLMLAASVNASVGLTQAIEFRTSTEGFIRTNSGANVLGLLGQRNHLATLMSLGLAVVMVCLNRADPLHSSHGRATYVLSMVLMISFTFVLAATSSRTGLLQLCFLAIFLCVIRSSLPNTAWGGMAVAGLVYGLASIAMLNALGYVGSENRGVLGRLIDGDGTSRWLAWSNVSELVATSPWSGHGWRSLAYLHYSTDFSGPRFMEMLDNAHNLPLHLAVELGIPVALAFCAFVAWALWRSRPWTEQRWDRQMAWAILLLIGIHSMVEYPLWYGPFFMTTLGAIGILAADSWQKWHSALTDSIRRAIDLGVKILLFAGLALVAYVAWDYHRASQIYLPAEQRSSAYAQDPLAAAKRSVLFQNHALFAELQVTPLTPANSARMLELSLQLVKWSPEPRIIEKLIESAVMQGQDELALFHIRRYRIAYPQAYAKWSQSLSMDGKGS